MKYFFDCVETIPEGVGWAYYSPLHLIWLGFGLAAVISGCLCYRRLDAAGRRRMRYVLAGLTVGNPLLLFEQLFGNHLIGIPILISVILVVLYTPWVVLDRRKTKKTTNV